MSPSLAHALFTILGKDTYEIASMRSGRTEAEVIKALAQYRRMKSAGRDQCKTVGQAQAQDVRV